MNKITQFSSNVAEYNGDGSIGSGYITSATFYGKVNNGITTITDIKIDNGIYTSFFPVNYFPNYIVIEGKRYNWSIDSTLNSNVRTAHVVGLPITINNIFFHYSYGYKENPQKYTDIETFYYFRNSENETYAFNASDWGIMQNFSISPDKSICIDGKNSVSADYDAYYTPSDSGGRYNNVISVGDTYRFTWTLGDNKYIQNIKATNEYSISSGDFVIPKSWCNSIPNNPDYDQFGYNTIYLKCEISLVLDGKTIHEWVPDSNGSYAGGSIYPYPSDDVVPTISSITLSDSNGKVPTSWKTFLQYLSNLAISSISASGAYSSTITKVQLDLKNNDTSLASVSGTLFSLPQTSVINQYGVFDVTVTVTDTRNRTASKSAQATFLPYSAPIIDGIVSQRCLKDGTINNDGTYVQLSGTPVIASCNGHNSYRIYVAYKRTDSATYNAEKQITSFPAVIGSGDFDPEYSYDIQYRIVDQFNTTYFVDYVSTAIMLMHFMREGRGVAFGQKATIQNCMDVSFNALFRQNVGFEVDGKFYTISDIVKHINGLTPQESLDWVENNTKDFSNS